jgi:PAS domain S-box-containing protein
MEANATNVVQARRGRIRSLFRRTDLSIRLRLIVCFVLIVLLMIAADAVAVWQYWQIEAPAQRVSKSDQISHAVVRVHLDVDTFRDSMATLASSHDARQFSGEAASIRQKFLEHVDHAEQMLKATPDVEQDAPTISSALESLRVTLLSQLDTAIQLAAAGQWNAVQVRLAVQIPAIIEFTSSLVERADQQALQQQGKAIEDAQKARQRLFIIVPIAALLTLLAASGLGWYVTRTITGPLSTLTVSAKALARGDFQHKVHLRGNNELAALGNAFNYAAQQLQNLYEDLRRSERELRDVINTVPAHAWSALPDGEVDFVNQRWQQFTGLPAEDASRWNWEAVVHPDDQARFVADWRAALNSGRPMETEVRVRRADGEYRCLLVRNVPLHDEHGKILRWYGISTDIDDRKRAEQEREQLRADLAHVNRVSMLGELAASVSHELKQPITAAMTNARTCIRWLKRDQPDVDEALEVTMRIVRDGTRATEIIDRLRSLYKKSSPQRELVAVNEVVREMFALLRGEANRYSIVTRAELAPDLPRITADRVQLQQVFMNLMLNAIEAMKDTGGELTIKTELGQEGPLLISISDTGVGLPAENADEIFNAFFTTKPEGSGMGLAISRSIVESHGGRLWATPSDGRGATFQFTLPQQRAAHA